MSLFRRAAIGFPTNWEHRRGWSLDAVAQPGCARYFIEWDPGDGVYGEGWAQDARDADGALLGGPRGCYHAIRIAQFALHRFGVWKSDGALEARVDFFAQARWLRDYHSGRNASGLYSFDFPWTKYGAGAGWVSAMAQGEAISVLLRAEHEQPGAGYAQAARRAAQPFHNEIGQGGVVWRSGDDIFFEEIANSHAAHVLNGCIFALFGVWELWQCDGDERLRVLAQRCSQTLLRWLPRYDTGWWSLYSLMRSKSQRPHVATLKYHEFHIAQLHVLAAMFSEPRFEEMASRWTAYENAPRCRRQLIRTTLQSLPERLLRHDTVAGGARA